ncbi:MAG: acyltransferase [Planctomycetes bacterium]|nr:acyltransferase [Planctomycetota bacterium]
MAITPAKLGSVIAKGDIRFHLYERWSLLRGKWSTAVSKLFYGGRLKIQKPYRVWGKIRFLLMGPGTITIGKDFHAVSARNRSVFTLFTPCHLTIIGEGRIEIGEHVGLNGNVIAARSKVTIGDYTMIGPNTMIIDHDGHQAWPPRERWTTPGAAAPIVIEPDVWIGMNCIILKGVTVGRGSIIAAGSVVIGDVDPGCLYAGNPAKKIKELG